MTALPTRRRALLASAATIVAGSSSAFAADFPSKPIRIVSPFPAGGIVDQIGRILSGFLAGELGQSVIVDALPGAGGAIGTQAVARAEPDGHTWDLATISHIATPLFQPVAYDPIKDFAAASLVGYGRAVAVVPVSSPVKTLKDLVALAKAKPGQLNYLNPGFGSVAHLTTELLKLKAGIVLESVAYKGLPAGVQDLVADRLDFGVVSLPVPLPLVQSGKLRAIGIMGSAREAELPEVMTYEEQGFAGAQILSWTMVAVPAATPKPLVARINTAMAKALADAGVRKQLAAAFITVAPPMAPDQVQSLMVADAGRLAALVKDADIKVR